MREAMKVYGGDTSVAPTEDDVQQATAVFKEELEILKSLFHGYSLSPFLNPECDPIERYRLLAKAAEYVFVSTARNVKACNPHIYNNSDMEV